MLRGKGSPGLLLVVFTFQLILNIIYANQVYEAISEYSNKYPQYLLTAGRPVSLQELYPGVSLIYLPCGTVVSLNLTSKSLLWTIRLKDYQISAHQDPSTEKGISIEFHDESTPNICGGICSSIIMDPITGDVYSYCNSYKCLNLMDFNDVTRLLVSLLIDGSCEKESCFNNVDYFSVSDFHNFIFLPKKGDIREFDQHDVRYFYDSNTSEIELFACFGYKNSTYCFDFVWNDYGLADYVSEIRIVTRDGDIYHRSSSIPDSFYTVSFITNSSHDMCLFHVYKDGIGVLNKCSLSLIVYFLKNGLLELFLENSHCSSDSCSKFFKIMDYPMPNLQLANKFHYKSIKATRSIFTSYDKSPSIKPHKNMPKMFHGTFYQNPTLKFSWKLKSRIVDTNTIPHNESQNIHNEENIILVSFLSFWKEILCAAFMITIIVNIVLYAIRHYVKKKKNSDYGCPGNSTVGKSHPSSSEESGYDADILDNHCSDKSVVSRYKNDFEHIECIGRGGFGVVFKSKNVLDDCLYAVKRIELPDCVDAREKVMREVKALAKLNHNGIIRFYNAWFENAPEVEMFDIVSKHASVSESNDISISPDNDYCNISGVFDDSFIECSLMNLDKNGFNDNDDVIIDFFPNGNKNNDKLWDSSSYSETECTSSYASANFGDDGYSLEEDDDSQVSECIITSCGGDRRCLHSRKVHLYIQMQLCKNKTLRNWLKKTKYSRSHVKSLDIFRQILSAIEFIHSQCLTHRDLKPSNIFFAFDGSVKIGDFGLVTRFTSRLSGSYHKLVTLSSNVGDNDLNESNVGGNNSITDFAGTSLYMSPEQIRGLPYDSKVDIYSLGLIFFELLVPFKTEMERFKMLTQARSLEFPQVFLLEYPLELNLLKWILDSDPTKRPTATQIRTSYAFQELMVRTNAVPLQLSSGCKLA